MISLALKFLIAHILGDFVFQSDKWVKNKKKKKHKSKYLYYHLLVHTLSLLIVLKFNFQYWLGILVIIVSHFIIDLMKINLYKSVNEKQLFVLDQLAHLIVIALVVYFYQPYAFHLSVLYETKSLILILALFTITSIASVILKLLMSSWSFKEDQSKDSLKNAGKYIGILERLFVFGFIIINQWPAIGLLMTAKSVFRFGDLSKAKDRKLTEYVLIGTLLSFGIAVFIGLLYNYAIQELAN